MINWIPPKKAPRDGTMILAVFDCEPTPMAAMWNKVSKNWVAATPQVDLYNGTWDDTYFDSVHFCDSAMKVWAEIVDSPKD